jgi:diguanylate cyclase (GGDEF)-like protein
MAIRLEPELYREVKDLVARDERTGAYKNGFFRLSIEDELSRARVLEYDLSLLALQVIGIGEIEEEHGFNVAQQMLTTVVKGVHLNTRDTDWIAQWESWDQFIVVLPGCGEAQVEFIVEKLQTELNAEKVSVKWGVDLPVRVRLRLVDCTDGNIEVAYLLERLEREFQRFDQIQFEAETPPTRDESGMHRDE